MENQLSPADLADLKKAQDSKKQLETMGLNKSDEEEDKPLPEVKTYDTFLDIKGIPSKGYFYEKSIKGQPLVTSDMLLIQSMDEDNLDDRFTQIFKRRVIGIDPNDILCSDELYISYWLRESSLPGMAWPHDGYQCEKCKLIVPSDKAEFMYDSVKFSSNIDEIKELYGDKGYVEFTLPDSKQICRMYLKRRGHVENTKKVLDEEFYNKGNIPEDYEIEALEMLSSIDIGAKSLPEAYKKFSKFTAIDFNAFVKNVKKHNLRTETDVQLTCPQCQEVTPKMEYPFRKDIYFPGNN